MLWKTVWAAEPDFVAIVFLKDSLPCKLNLCGFPRLTLVAYIRHTWLSSSAEFTPHSYYVQETQEVLYWWGNKMSGFWCIIGMKIVAVALQTVLGFVFSGWLFLKPFLSHTYLGRFFFLPTIIWLQLQSLKSFTWLWLCSAISSLFFFLLFCFFALIQVVIIFYGSRMDSCKALKTFSILPFWLFQTNFLLFIKAVSTKLK